MSDRCYTEAMKTVAETQAELLNVARPLTQTEALPLEQCLGRVLAEDVRSPIPVPGYDNSAMDGYAVRAADLKADIETELPISQRIPAGSVGAELAPGSCARIFTGAPIPKGADAVVMQEDVTANENTARFSGQPPTGDNIRPAGNDINQGDTVLTPGVKLEPQHLGLLASLGLAEISVFRRLRVGVFFTGDELVKPGQPLSLDGQIYNSNVYTLQGLLENFGCQVENLGIVRDDFEATRHALKHAAEGNDLIMTSGGVSVGEEDHVRAAVESLGRIDLWRIAVRPGKPFAFGGVGDAIFMGLPGNPVSVFATFMVLARPYILRMQGRTDVLPGPLPVEAGFAWPKARIRREFSRARLRPNASGVMVAELHPRQSSEVLSSVVWCDGLVEIPEGAIVKPGELVNFYPLSDLLR
ncbi:MAG: gephyrin-like molybdotransferase Glp [Gammaproteobacteria bacterium]